MTRSSLPLAPEAMLALSAFLRGIERRAAVFAELLSGSAARGDEAVAAAMLGFRNAAAERPLPDWDLQFWRLLLATPQLRGPAPGAQWPASMAVLAARGSALRAVLLLRLLSGLDDAQAAAALCVPRAVYVRASRQAPGFEGIGDDKQYAALAAEMQQCLRRLPAARLVGLAQSRERALQGAPAPSSGQRFALARRRPALALGLAACAIAFAASFLLDGGASQHGARPRALPPPSAPLATYDADFALLTHRDFDELAAAGNQGLLDDLDFYAWYAAQTAPATDAPADALPTPLARRNPDPAQAGRHGAR